MKVERSTEHTKFMHGVAVQFNARRQELIDAGVSEQEASDRANAEIIKPLLVRRRAANMESRHGS